MDVARASKTYPINFFLLCINLGWGFLCIIVGSILVNLSGYNESNIQFLHTFLDPASQEYVTKNKQYPSLLDDAYLIKWNQRSLYLLLLIIGSFCILMGFIMVLLFGIDIFKRISSGKHSDEESETTTETTDEENAS